MAKVTFYLDTRKAVEGDIFPLVLVRGAQWNQRAAAFLMGGQRFLLPVSQIKAKKRS